ncbi:MAG: winged helix-turn-helix domain-containing protein [Alphaproteobacteria bacterium]|nr:winged helix-turn-helix domain-containing protein [Alphaproteobacteria bacterium]
MTHVVRQDIHSSAELLAFSKTSENVRHSHRILAIRDMVRGDSRSDVCERYGVTRENLRHWVSWYNESGVDGLKDEARSGRPRVLPAEKISTFKQRIEAQPDVKNDGHTRWRAVDTQRILSEEYGVTYTSLYGVRKLCHALGLSYITARPTHPKHDAEAIEAFKKNSPKSLPKSKRRTQTKPSRYGAKTKAE